MSEGTPMGQALTDLAAQAPDRPALTCGSTTLTRRQLDEKSNSLAWALLDQGIEPGSRVALILPNGPDFVVTTLAIWKAGGTPIPIAPKMPPAERAAILALANPALTIEEPLTPAKPPTPPPPAVPRPWKILTSGGSTGRPKLIATTESGTLENAVLFGLAGQMQENRTALLTAPLTHNGPFMAMASALLFGNHVVLMERFDAAKALALLQDHQVDWMYAVPTMMHRIWRLEERPPLPALRTVFHLAAPIAPWLKQAWIDWLGPEKIWELYAGTESQAATLISGTEWLEHRGSVGRPIKGEIEIRTPTGEPAPPNTTGTVWMRPTTGPTYTYLGKTPTTNWESLGDMGHMDADGYLYLTDRETDMILVGGSNVYPAEIEAALEEHPNVTSSAVIGLPHEDLGNVPHAIVQLSTPTPDADLLKHLTARLAPYKLPRTFERTEDPLRDDAGKVRRSALRAARLP
ncbi:AMP-binding protein [Actinomadura barringtoniae]|uniref:AMP-binding protein n=1 Tax=Actinomadura barringtoniae TaxID=1427535 RepID=A0A939PLF6_9ACTN|nr:AMP-binding protein [Actinomadura barringtoniae]MBO2454502.1 AMP-binding protein [Actinomadura barringtoniae]